MKRALKEAMETFQGHGLLKSSEAMVSLARTAYRRFREILEATGTA